MGIASNIFRNWFSPKGRASRREVVFFLSILFASVLIIGYSFYLFKHIYIIISGFVLLTILIIGLIFIEIRRLHDVGVSGWFLLVPIYGWRLQFLPGMNGYNIYGAEGECPKDVTSVNINEPQRFIHTSSFIIRSAVDFYVIYLLILIAGFLPGMLLIQGLSEINSLIVTYLYYIVFIINLISLFCFVAAKKYYQEWMKRWLIMLFSTSTTLSIPLIVYIIYIVIKLFQSVIN